MKIMTYNCPCGSSISNYRHHFHSNKHLKYLSNNSIKDFSEILNEELYENLNEKMNELDENKSQINEGEYLEICNKLQKEYNHHKRNSFIKSYSNLENKIQNDLRLFNKTISKITYKNNKTIYYHKLNYLYYLYYSINNQIIIFKIDYISYVLNTNLLH